MGGLFGVVGRGMGKGSAGVEKQGRGRSASSTATGGYHRLLETMTQGVVYQDAEGHILFANPAAERILGLSLEQMRERTSDNAEWAATTEDNAPLPGRDHPAMVVLRTGNPITNFRMSVLNQTSGDRVWLAIDAIPLFQPGDAKPYQVYAIFSDITDRHRAEMATRLERERLDFVLKGTKLGTWVWNVQTGETEFNETWAAIVGYTLAELEPISIETWKRLTHPDDLPKAQAALDRCFSNEDIQYQCELRMRHKDGHWVWVLDRGQVMRRDADGQPLMMFGTHDDITQRKEAERALRESESQFKALFMESPVSIILHDKDTGEIVDANPAACRAYGVRSLEELKANDFWLDAPYSADDALAHIRSAAQDGPQTLEWMNRNRTGEVFWEQVHLMPITINGVPRVLAKSIDITARKEAEAQRENLVARLFHEIQLQKSLFESAKEVLEQDNFATIARRIFDEARKMTGAQSGYVALLTDDGSENEVLFLEAGGLPCSVDPDLPMPIRGLRAEAYKTGRAAVENDFMNSAWIKFMPPGHVNLQNVVFAPLNIGDKTVGIMGLANKPTDFTETDVRIAEAFGQLAAIALLNSRNIGALRDHEHYLEKILQITADGFWVINRKGRVTEVNDAYCAMSGYERDEILGLSINDLDPTESPQQTQERMAAIMDQGSLLFETQHRRKDGSLFPVEITVTHMKEHGNQFVCFCRDQSERKRQEEELRAANARLQALWSITSLSDADIKTISDHVLNTIVAMTNSAYGFYGFVNDDESVMTIHSWSGEAMEHCAMVDKPTKFRIDEAGLWGEAVRQRKPLIINDYSSNHQGKKGLPTGHVALTNLLVVPFISGDRITAVAAVANRLTDYEQDDITQLTSFLASVQALVESKRAETNLRESEDRYRALVNGLPDILMRFDREGRHLFASANVQTVTGMAPTAFIGRTHRELGFTESQCEFWESAIRGVFDSGTPTVTQFALETNGKETLFDWRLVPEVDDDGKVASVLSIARDVTARRKAEEALRKSEERMALILDCQNDAWWDWDLQTDELYYSKRWWKMLGYEENELPADSALWRRLAHPDDRERTEKALDDALTGTDVRYGIEFRLKHKDSHYVPELSQGYILRKADGTPYRVCGVNVDLTESKRAEAEQRELQQQLNQSQKMESVGRLAGGVAHDFNNMLGVILGHVELALEDVPSDSPLRSDLTEIDKAARRSADLTRQLLAFARRQTVAPRVLDLNKAVAAAFEMLKRLIGENISFVWRPANRLAPVRMDPTQIDQILANLVVNARDAIDGVGQIMIETAEASFDEAYCGSHMGFAPGDYVMLAVHDTGRGMDEETQERIFEPFFTTKQIGEGTGLGLATVYGIVKQNDCLVDVESQPGHGTAFRIYFPAYREDTDTTSPNEAEAEQATEGCETVLLVEDEKGILALGKRMLERLGYNVLTVASPGEALRLAREHSGTIDLLITDVVMPEMNGRDLARQLLSLYPDIKRLFMSGYTADVIAHHGILEEGVHFIQKPFSMEQLGHHVREALDSDHGN